MKLHALAIMTASLSIVACSGSSSSSSTGTSGSTGAGSASATTGGGSGGTTADGGTGGSSGSSGSTGSGCTITISGAYSEVLPCKTPVQGSYDTSNGLGALPIESIATVTGNAPKSSFGLKTNGDLQQQTYTYANVGEMGGSYLYDVNSGLAFSAKASANEGSLTWVISQLVVQNQSDAGTVYDAHGTIDGTLAGKANAANQTVTVHVDF